MELNLQFGYGMMDHSRVMLEAWSGGTVILSPRDLSPQQLERLAADVRSIPNGQVLFDPQFYLPHSDHDRLTSHDYWPSAYTTDGFWTGAELNTVLARVLELNETLDCSAVILPGLYAERVNDDWTARQALTIEEMRELTELPLYATVALSADAVRSDDSIDEVLAAVSEWDVKGIYLVCEHPKGEYLVSDATWMTNTVDLAAGLRLKNKAVIVGYCNHQMLALACAGVNAIASGTWMNVRSFPPDKFRRDYDDEIKQRATWYYCPQALSEYKIPFLDIARRQGLLGLMGPSPVLGSTHANALFSGVQPTSVRFTEQSAFRHYLQCLWSQVRMARASTFDETVAAHSRTLDSVETFLAQLQTAGVRGQNRDFAAAVDANRAALDVLRSTRGPMLRRRWSSL